MSAINFSLPEPMTTSSGSGETGGDKADGNVATTPTPRSTPSGRSAFGWDTLYESFAKPRMTSERLTPASDSRRVTPKAAHQCRALSPTAKRSFWGSPRGNVKGGGFGAGSEGGAGMEEEDEVTCVICLESLEGPTEDNVLPFTVPLSTALPCACQNRVSGSRAQVHEACLRQWLSACKRRAAEAAALRDEETDPESSGESGITCPLCRAPLPDAVAKALEVPARARAALAQCPQLYALQPLTDADGSMKCVVKVRDRSDSRRSSPTSSRAEDSNPRVLSLFVEGMDLNSPLLVARARKVLGSSKLATKFDIFFCSSIDTETIVATVVRNTFGTRWTVEDSNGKVRSTVEYEANRFANRPRAMRIELAHNRKKYISRQPEFSPRLGGYCLDFYGRARLASVRNFQLIDPDEGPLMAGDEEARAKLLFGRWSEDEFRLDAKAPFSIVDSFSIAVSSFATKLACI